MKANIGTLDRVIRFVIAALFIILYFTHTVTGIVGIILLVLAGIFLVTGILGYCALYIPFGISTKTKK